MMSYEVEAVTKPRLLGEGPHWDVESQNLYFVDDFGSSIHRYNPEENRETYCKIHDSASVSIVIPIRGSKNKFAVTVGKNLTVVTWDGESEKPESIETVATVDDECGKERNQFNDGKADSAGRLWIGTMGAIDPDGTWSPEKGSLYSFGKNEKPVRHLENVTISNGLAWKSDGTTMFYIDSPTRRIDRFDFDEKEARIGNRRTFYDANSHFADENGGPDGMTIDEDENLWIALFGTGTVINVNGSTGELIRKIQLPAPNPTSVAFGGKRLDELYVTSATFELTDEERERFPLSGCTFRVTGLGVKGRRAFHADL